MIWKHICMTQLDKIEKRVEALERQLQSLSKGTTLHVPVRVSFGNDDGRDFIDGLRHLASLCDRQEKKEERR
jgi:allophanate hydrolase subunit 1